jgi:HAD superfamily hydrolase (TIGR01509 family)
MIQAIVFDMDGLMFDSEPLYFEVGRQVLARRGKEMTRELANAMMGLRRGEALEVMRAWHELEDAIDVLDRETEELYFEVVGSQLQPMRGLMEVLGLLERRGLPRAVATSSARRYAEHALGRFALTGRFAFLLAAEDVANGKPHPEIYQKAAERFSVPPRQMLVLEDSQAGLRSAKAAGAQCVVIPQEHNNGQDFSTADARVEALDDPQLLELIAAR